MKEKVYIAGPYSKGDVLANVHKAIKVANDLAKLGFYPFVPHLLHYWHELYPLGYDFCCEIDNEYLLVCDAVIRIPGESPGSDAEEDLARKNDIPVFYNIYEVKEYFEEVNV